MISLLFKDKGEKRAGGVEEAKGAEGEKPI
jgi:hypothetical protein